MSHLDYVNLIGRAWGKLWPKRALPGVPSAQPRDYALRVLFDYLAMVEWRHEGAKRGGDPVAFKIERARMYEEKPDDNIEGKLPALAVDPGPGNWQDPPQPLGPPVVNENSYDGQNVLIELGTYKETFKLEVWASSPVMRRAILAGLDIAFAPSEDFSGITFIIPDYYNVWCWFGLENVQRYEDQDGSRRRYATADVELWVPMVHKVPAGLMVPRLNVEVDNPDGVPDWDWTLDTE